MTTQILVSYPFLSGLLQPDEKILLHSNVFRYRREGVQSFSSTLEELAGPLLTVKVWRALQQKLTTKSRYLLLQIFPT